MKITQKGKGGKKGKRQGGKKNRNEADKWGKEEMEWIRTGKKGGTIELQKRLETGCFIEARVDHSLEAMYPSGL